MGPVKAVEQGLISIEKFWQAKRSLDLFHLATKKPHEAEGTRGIWIVGPPGTGKTHRARHRYPGPHYLKS